MEFSAVFHRYADALARHPRYIDSEGGARSGKTISALQLLVIMANTDKTPTITSVVSETMPHLKRGAVRDFQSDAVMGASFDEAAGNKTAMTYTCPNGSIIEFFSADSPSKVHGPQRHRLFINEAQNIPYDTARQLFVRTSEFILYDYNPTHPFWAHERIQPRENCIHVHSTYKDNPYLPPEQIREIEANRHDERWWRVYGEGKVGTLEGVVYDFTPIDDLPDTDGMLETYGLDFGFTNSITACAHCFIHQGRKEIYLDEVLYRKGLLNSDIADALRDAGVTRSVTVYADAAEPKSIADLETYGFTVEKCDKTSDTDKHNPITAQVTFLKTYRIFVTKRSLNLIDEMRGYVWAQDRNGDRLNVPVKVRDHLMDAFRYGCYTPLARQGGQYHIGFGHTRHRR